MSPSPSRSSTSRLAAACAVGAACWAACGGGGNSNPSDAPSDTASCGPGSAPVTGMVASSSAITLTYGNLSGSFNNDCGAPSISIEGHQSAGEGQGRITLCVAQPAQLATQSQALGFALSSPIVVQDFGGDTSSCTLAVDKAQPISGAASSTGLCNAGHDAAGFALTITGAATLTRTCGATTDSVQLTLSGTVAVAMPQ